MDELENFIVKPANIKVRKRRTRVPYEAIKVAILIAQKKGGVLPIRAIEQLFDTNAPSLRSMAARRGDKIHIVTDRSTGEKYVFFDDDVVSSFTLEELEKKWEELKDKVPGLNTSSSHS